MKKRYMEPQMIVEDFTVSEMVAATCVITPSEITVVSQMSAAKPPCKGVQEYDGTPEYEVYRHLDSAYAGEYDANRNGHHQSLDGTYDEGDFVFTSAYRKASKQSKICVTDPFEKGYNFVDNFVAGVDLVCKDQGDSPLINS